MTQYAGLRGIAGSVIDGVCRDVNRAISDDYPLFTAGRWMRTGKDRVQVGGINEPVGIGKVRVNPRDIVVADVNGVVIVPRDRVRGPVSASGDGRPIGRRWAGARLLRRGGWGPDPPTRQQRRDLPEGRTRRTHGRRAGCVPSRQRRRAADSYSAAG